MQRYFLFAAACTLLPAQNRAPVQSPRFTVASVKECPSAVAQIPAKSSPGRLSLSCWDLSRLIQDAYDVFATGIVNPLNPTANVTPLDGQPSWVDSVRYTIDARVDDPQTLPMMRGPMMQALLEERFQLRIHRETRTVPVYALRAAKNGVMIEPTKLGECTTITADDLMQGRRLAPGEPPWCSDARVTRNGTTWTYDVRGMSLDVFVKYLRLDRPVINRTGLSGIYDLHLEWPADPPDGRPAENAGPYDPDRPSLVNAMVKTVGLRIEPDKGPRDFLVIDHVERPTGN